LKNTGGLTLLSAPVMFSTFIFKHISEIAPNSKRVQEYTGILSTEVFFDLPAIKHPRLRARVLEELLTNAGY
jgi:hypothetical protein